VRLLRPHLRPGRRHPITVRPAAHRVTVSALGRTVISTDRALVLQEASYPPVYYVPREDVDAEPLRPSDTQTYCPFKGEASYVDLVVGDQVVSDVAWSYVEPYEAVQEIAGHLAFYPDRADISVEDGEHAG
jgi:uncharacterized protein (DUF427 family)